MSSSFIVCSGITAENIGGDGKIYLARIDNRVCGKELVNELKDVVIVASINHGFEGIIEVFNNDFGIVGGGCHFYLSGV